MRYGDLFTLNPIETVIQIQHADNKAKAATIVDTFVITPSLGEAIENLAIPQLDFESGVEGKGIFVVGNYGTGKSHVMSFLSLVAEDAAHVDRVRAPDWRPKLAKFAGHYRVRRCEIGGSLSTLYGIVTRELEALGRSCGMQEFTFADQRDVTSIKSELARYIQAFDTACPGKGVLLVVDEVLNYLRSRDDANLVLDMEVLRSLGEFCNGSRFTLMLGVQEMLFNNPRFNHIASDVNRVRQRFHDFVIDSKGVGQLIEQYLFAKSGTQRQQARELMQQQVKLFEVVGPELEQFVALFPAHPRFVEEFQRVFVVERREILTVLTKEARALASQDVDADHVRLITSDGYWKHIEQDPGLNANGSVRQVKQNVSVLKGRIESEFPAAEDKRGACQLVEALAVNRLTTPTITDAVGLTPAELKNNLLWYTPVPMRDAGFLTNAAKRLLDLTREAANGQYLAVAEARGQYYIDPTRVRDYDQEVRSRAGLLARHVVQRYLNELVTRALELDNDAPVQENRLWNYGLVWSERNVERPGWLFFGFPNQRSTAKPPKDFYLFLIPCQRVTGTTGEEIPNVPDETYWFFEDFPPARFEAETAAQASTPETFLDWVRLYAAASELASECGAGDEKTAFLSIAKKHLDVVAPALADNAGEWVSVQWNGQRRRFREWVMDIDPGKATALFKTRFDAISQSMFAPHFADKYPDYPTFSVKIQERTRGQNALAAIEVLSEVGLQTQNGWIVLSALGLAKDNALTLDQSPWLGKVRARLKPLTGTQFLNHGELFERIDDKWWFRGECVEAEWLHVALAAGVRAGDLVVYGPNNKRYDASNLMDFYREVKSFDGIIRVGKPTEIPYDLWRPLFELFEVNTGLLANPSTHDEAIRQFNTKVVQTVNDVVECAQRYGTRLPFLMDEVAPQLSKHCESFGAVQRGLETYLVPINTKAKMQNLRITPPEIGLLADNLAMSRALSTLLTFVGEAQVAAQLGAIDRFLGILGSRSPDFGSKATAVGVTLNSVYSEPATLSTQKDGLTSSIAETVGSAVGVYHGLHKRHRLDVAGDGRKKKLVNGAELKRLNRLAQVKALGTAKLEDARQRLATLLTCGGCTDQELLSNARSLCPKCSFSPAELVAEDAALDVLAACETQVGQLTVDWTEQLLRDLQDPSVRASLDLLAAEARELIEAFVAAKALPADITDGFINAVNTALSGLKRRPVKAPDFAKQVLGDGAPVRADEIRQRLDKWISAELGTDDKNTVRFVLED